MVSHADRTLTGWEYSLLLSATVERARASGENEKGSGVLQARVSGGAPYRAPSNARSELSRRIRVASRRCTTGALFA